MRNKDERLSRSAALVVESIHWQCESLDTAGSPPPLRRGAGGARSALASTLSYARALEHALLRMHKCGIR
jgi:hypothetical protein